MKVLDETGMGVFWALVKEYIANHVEEVTNNYLPLSGGTMTGDIVRKNAGNTTLYSIGINGDINHDSGTGWITCKGADTGGQTIMCGNGIQVIKNNPSDGEPRVIYYRDDNIHITIYHQGSVEQTYKFNLQKLIDDGYLIEE